MPEKRYAVRSEVGICVYPDVEGINPDESPLYGSKDTPQ